MWVDGARLSILGRGSAVTGRDCLAEVVVAALGSDDRRQQQRQEQKQACAEREYMPGEDRCDVQVVGESVCTLGIHTIQFHVGLFVR
jgi:hypothetical protein